MKLLKLKTIIFAVVAASFLIAGCSVTGQTECKDCKCKMKKTRAPVVHKYSK